MLVVASESVYSCPMEAPIATKRNTYAKRQREQDKKERADKKRAKRDHKKRVGQFEAVPADQPSENQSSAEQRPL